MNNLPSYGGIVDAKIGASDKGLPVHCQSICTLLSIKFDARVNKELVAMFFQAI